MNKVNINITNITVCIKKYFTHMNDINNIKTVKINLKLLTPDIHIK